ncbi:hypothetical protein [Paenibacillus cremeus]|uniref:Uncharacterized protein n=1 Tax=Paenibacillus cremeus TaxID=2163881 RepID=A0A559JHN7_9BACL|nr:hypothetical protein [Paenibacillus cremeus]TVX99395.1 hypothetical protein FPZ49_33860 [Paenibacillus cremeus]
MTIIAMFRWGDKAVFASDFRVSFTAGNQVDIMSKFIQFENRIGIFTAGDVGMWKGAVPKIESVLDETTFENVGQQEGPLHLALQRYTESTPANGNLLYGGIAFMVEPERELHTVFKLYGQAGRGFSITTLEDGCVVMGSGDRIPGIEEHLGDILRRHTEVRSYNLPEVESVLKRNLHEWIARCGSSAYRKLGISPVMATSRLAGGAFQMTAIETHGDHYPSNGPRKSYHYSFTRVNGQLMLKDHRQGKTLVVNEIVDFSIQQDDDELFDPQGLTERFDPCSYAVGDTVFLMNQWVEADFVERSVYKTGIFRFKGQPLCNPNYERLSHITVEDMDPSETTPYANTGYIALLIPEEKHRSFEAGIQEHILNHQWLADHINNYEEIHLMT